MLALYLSRFVQQNCQKRKISQAMQDTLALTIVQESLQDHKNVYIWPQPSHKDHIKSY